MKYTSVMFGFGVLVVLWIVFPTLFVYLNSTLALPVYVFGMFRELGVILVIVGIGLSILASKTFLRFGEGTPAITEPPKKLVIEGVYKRTRNPIYVAHVLITLGLFVSFGHFMLIVYTILMAVGLHFYLVRVEEPTLRERYGEEYIGYTKQVGRWV